MKFCMGIKFIWKLLQYFEKKIPEYQLKMKILVPFPSFFIVQNNFAL